MASESLLRNRRLVCLQLVGRQLECADQQEARNGKSGNCTRHRERNLVPEFLWSKRDETSEIRRSELAAEFPSGNRLWTARAGSPAEKREFPAVFPDEKELDELRKE